MILLTRSRDTKSIKSGFRGKGLLKKHELLAAAFAANPKFEFAGRLGDWGKMKGQLLRETHGKCAYCEANAAAVSYGDVEHFRPKSIYWWLALCVDNYVFSCQQCNQHYKSNDFPTGKVRLRPPTLGKLAHASPDQRVKLLTSISPDPCIVNEAVLAIEWSREAPFLPHPYFEDPEPLFSWKVVETNEEVLLVQPENPSTRSRRAVQASLQHLGLNREPLPNLRWTFYDILVDRLDTIHHGNQAKSQKAYDKVIKMCAPSAQFAGMCRYFARQAGVDV